MTSSDGSTASGIIKAALGHMQDRAATYDNPKGERSMNSTVLAFAAVTGVLMTEEQGWLFMALLKAVRSQQGSFRADSYEDGAAYFALAGEAAYKDRAPVDLPCNNPVRAFHSDPMQEPAAAMEDDSARMQAIGQNGNDGAIYREPAYVQTAVTGVNYCDGCGRNVFFCTCAC